MEPIARKLILLLSDYALRWLVASLVLLRLSICLPQLRDSTLQAFFIVISGKPAWHKLVITLGE
jgi:hypothetical protein